MENKYNKEDINKYLDNNFNKISTSKYNNIKYRKDVKTVPLHEVIFEHVDTTTRPYERRMVNAKISGVVYTETTIKNLDIRYVLNEAIEKYLQYRHLGKVDENDFVKFINKTFHINVISIDSVDLSVTKPLKQEPKTNKPVEIQLGGY